MFFERSQDFCLRFKAHIPDFIKEERAAVRPKEFAFFVCNCRWERSATMAEQLAFNEILRNCCAVYLYEHFILARTVSVNRTCCQLFAGAGFAKDEHAAASRRHKLNLLPEGFHGNTVAHDYATGSDLPLEVAVFEAEFPCLRSILHQNQRLLDGQRLLKKIKRAQFGRANRGFNRPVTGDDDDFRGIFQLSDSLKRFQAVHARQPNVEENDVERLAADRFQARLPAPGSSGCVTFILEHALQ